MTETFTYRAWERQRTSVLSRARAEALADLFEAEGCTPTSWDDNLPRAQPGCSDLRYSLPPRMWTVNPRLAEVCVHITERYWEQDVYHILTERQVAAAKARRLLETEALEAGPVREYLLGQQEASGFRSPEVVDISDLRRLAMEDRTTPYKGRDGVERRMGKPAYRPEPGCEARLHLKKAVLFSTRQESYADHATYAVPVTIPETCDRAVLKRNLSRFSEALRTTNGLAGFGSTWTVWLAEAGGGFLVVMDTRASIAD